MPLITTPKIPLQFLAVLLLIFANQAFGHGMSEAEKLAIIAGGNLAYLKIGVTHMLTGYDHLLFVFGVVFLLNNFKDIVKYITAFTLGHSATLIWATFNGVQVNYFLIDAIIALSVCYIAFANLDGFKKLLKINPPNMLMMIAVLGLIHGLGLSTRLQELPLNEDQLLMNILSFNAGIELGQIAALAVMLLIMKGVRKATGASTRFSKLSWAANSLLIIAGVGLFVVQVQGYMASQDPLAAKADVSQTLPLSSEQVVWKDTIGVTIPAKSGKEYKFHLAQGAVLEYQWETDGEPLYYDFHGEPTGDTTGYFMSYKEQTSDSSSGQLTAPFGGIHGWYWENATDKPVQIELKASGEYTRMD